MGVNRSVFGDGAIVEDKAVAISIERYNELIRKELFYDAISYSHDMIVTLRERVAEKGEAE